MSDRKNSPKPWKIPANERGKPDYTRDAAGDMVFCCLSMEFGEADAKLIERSVEYHDALVAMVSELRTLVRVTGPMTTARERADALLARIAADA